MRNVKQTREGERLLEVVGVSPYLQEQEALYFYRVQFPVMQQYERDTWYNRNGRIVFTNSEGLIGVGFPRKGKGRGANKQIGWEDIKDMTSGSVCENH